MRLAIQGAKAAFIRRRTHSEWIPAGQALWLAPTTILQFQLNPPLIAATTLANVTAVCFCFQFEARSLVGLPGTLWPNSVKYPESA